MRTSVNYYLILQTLEKVNNFKKIKKITAFNYLFIITNKINSSYYIYKTALLYKKNFYDVING